MMISTKGKYALRVLTDIAEHQSDGFLPLREIAKRQDISEKYLEYIVKVLVKNQVLEGVRGKGGGYRFVRSPEQITAWEVLDMVEESMAPIDCLKDNADPCDRVAEHRMLPMWQGLYSIVRDYLSGFTITDFIHGAEPGNDYVI